MIDFGHLINKYLNCFFMICDTLVYNLFVLFEHFVNHVTKFFKQEVDNYQNEMLSKNLRTKIKLIKTQRLK